MVAGLRLLRSIFQRRHDLAKATNSSVLPGTRASKSKKSITPMGRNSRNVRGGYKGETTATASSSKSGHGVPKRSALTHFLCLPLVTDVTRPQLEASIAQFRDIVAAENEGSGVDESIPLKAIRPVGSIHLTLGVASLEDIDRVSEAIGLLQTLDMKRIMQEVITEQSPPTSEGQTWPLQISLTSLHSMRPPQRATILYASPSDPQNILYPFCVKIRELFTAKGFLIADDRPLKLHATILNTIYAKSGGPRSKAPMQFDATSLLEKCRESVWAADFTIEKVAICKMGAKKIMDEDGNVADEQYEEVASIDLPLS